MNQTLKDILDLLLNPTVTFFIGILTVLMSRNNNAFSTARERLTLAYHPLFVELEPLLYQKVCYDDIVPFLQKYREIEKQYALFINPTLRNAINNINEFSFDIIPEFDGYEHDTWFEICDVMSRDYDSLCRQCHIPVRSISYRIENKQYRNRFSLFLGWILINSGLTFGLPCLIACFVFPKLWFLPYIAFVLVYSQKITQRL